MDEESLKDMGCEPLNLPWTQKMLLKFWPSVALRSASRRMKIKNIVFDKLHEVFSKVEKVEIIPLNPSGSRGFMLVLDRETSFYFYQDGDHFKYDGFEMGPYDAGDVTIFDNLKNQ